MFFVVVLVTMGDKRRRDTISNKQTTEVERKEGKERKERDGLVRETDGGGLQRSKRQKKERRIKTELMMMAKSLVVGYFSQYVSQ